MALRFCDSFDHYSLSDMLTKWTGNANSVNITPNSATNGRNGTSSLRLINWNGSMWKLFDNQPSWYMGFAMTASSYITGAILCSFVNSGTTQIDLRVDSLRRLYVTRNGTTLATSTNTIAINTWNYIEFGATINSVTGSYNVNVNGINWLTATNINTQFTANAYAETIYLGSANNTSTVATIDFDDLYICDGTGTINNTFLGDIRIEYLTANGAGSNTNLLIGGTSAAATNWASVKDIPQDVDNTFVYGNSVGQEDTYNLADMSSNPQNIYGVQTVLMIRKDDAGNRTASRIIRNGGADYVGPTVAPSTSYQYFIDMLQQDPSTSGNWTLTGVNGMEMGMRILS